MVSNSDFFGSDAFRAKHPKVSIYGLSIYTCNGFPHFGLVLNGNENLAEVSDEDLSCYKYCPDEWAFWDDFDCLDSTVSLIESLHQKFDHAQDQFDALEPESDDGEPNKEDHYWQDNVEKICQTAVCALKELKEAQCFDWFAAPPVVMVWFSDPSDWEVGMSLGSVETLCGEQVVNEMKRFVLASE